MYNVYEHLTCLRAEERPTEHTLFSELLLLRVSVCNVLARDMATLINLIIWTNVHGLIHILSID